MLKAKIFKSSYGYGATSKGEDKTLREGHGVTPVSALEDLIRKIKETRESIRIRKILEP